ncbi:magnesium transporter NIPA-domain-containing protein [Mycena floridula]|nr:magnesium transporter NIPA-domain-containing protein [Mycena floridula]
MSSTTSSAASATSSASGSLGTNANLKIVGILLAVFSGLLIGSSFVLKKKGLLRSQAGATAGEGVAYLKSPLWWGGMTMMIMGELCNFAAYAFVEAIVVTPLGALSVVVCAILSSLFLNEKLSFFGWLGCALSIFGSTIIALNGPKEATVGHIKDFQKLFLAPGFLAYAGTLIAASLVIVFFFAPKYGKKSMLWYIFVCSMIGGISVSVTTGLGAAIVTTAQGENQFKFPFMYFLLVFVAITLITEVYYLNVALALFNTGMVTPTYYVIFTFFTMVTTVVLFQGLESTVTQILTIVMAFLVICVGITILQMSKVDPTVLNKLDRRSTMLLQASRVQTENEEKGDISAVEDPGMDTLRGSFGAVGSIIRARTARRMSMRSSQAGSLRAPRGMHGLSSDGYPWPQTASPKGDAPSALAQLNGVQRHQLYDAPMPMDSTTALPDGASLAGATQGDDASSLHSNAMSKRPTIKFTNEDVVHSYHPTGVAKGERDDKGAIHEHRLALGQPGLVMHGGGSSQGYPPFPPAPRTTAQSTPDRPTTSDLLGFSKESPISPEDTVRPGFPLQQTVSMPSSFMREHEVQSAPPTMNPRFAKPGRMDARNLFTDSPSGATLLSFPSVTDSAWDGDSMAESTTKERGRTTKKYPKGADDDDDREESASLWQRSGGESPPEGGVGGIRLVPQSSARF